MRTRKLHTPKHRTNNTSALLGDSNDVSESELGAQDLTFKEFTTDYILPELQPSEAQTKSNNPFPTVHDRLYYSHKQQKLTLNQHALPKISSRLL